MIRCILHVHSTWSDGEFTMGELRELFVTAGVGVVLMTDHDTSFSAGQLQSYRDECESLSDERLRFIPGLEFTARDRMHILGYGVTELASADDPATIIRHIGRQGGISVIAHPMDAHFGWIERLDALPDGLEVWNSKYDGRYAPRARTFALYHRLRHRRPEMRAFYGADLHWKKQCRDLMTEVDVDVPDPSTATVLSALRAGRYTAVMHDLRLPADGVVEAEELARLDRLQARSSRAWRVLRRAKALSGPLARLLPTGIKAQLRRLF